MSDATIGFDMTIYDIFENEGVVNVGIVLTGRTAIALPVLLSTRDGTATCEWKQNSYLCINVPCICM